MRCFGKNYPHDPFDRKTVNTVAYLRRISMQGDLRKRIKHAMKLNSRCPCNDKLYGP